MPDAGADLRDRGQIGDLLRYLLIRHCSVAKLALLVEPPRPDRAISLQRHPEPRARSNLRDGFPQRRDQDWCVVCLIGPVAELAVGVVT